MHFAADPWLIALVVPPLIWLTVKLADRRAELRVQRLLGDRGAWHREDWNPRLRGWRRFLYLAGLFWLIVALARPQWGASEVTVTQRGRDVVVALDVSNSMLAEDVTPSRLERAKAELTTFLRRQQDSRVGLVLFAGAAFVQCPLTADYGTAEIFLQMAAPDMISAQGTALSSALEVSRELLLSGRPEQGGDDFQAILLVTDGEDLEGDWEQEAQNCRREGITVIPVGIGEETGGLIPVTDDQGRPDGFLKDEEGQLVLSRIDLASLERLASIGGGSTFRVGLDGLAGERLRTVLERLGRRDFEQRQVTRWQERYPWFLGLALGCLLLAVALPSRSARPATAAILLAVALAAASPATAQVIRPGWADAAERGREAYAAGDYEAALQEFENARAQAPDDPRLSLAVGETLFRLERFEEAEREFTRARQLTDRRELRAESLYNAGTNALARGDAGQAVERLRESLRLDPGRADALHNLEAALLMQQQQQQQEQQQQDQEGDQQEQEQDQQQEQQEQQDQGDQQQDQQQDQQEQQQEQQQQEQEQQQQEQPSEEEIDREQALQILKALDRDEQELKRAVQRRLRGGGSQSGKRW